MTSEYDDFIEAMPEEWQYDEDSEEQVLANIADYKALRRYNEERINDLKKVSTSTKE